MKCHLIVKNLSVSTTLFHGRSNCTNFHHRSRRKEEKEEEKIQETKTKECKENFLKFLDFKRFYQVSYGLD